MSEESKLESGPELKQASFLKNLFPQKPPELEGPPDEREYQEALAREREEARVQLLKNPQTKNDKKGKKGGVWHGVRKGPARIQFEDRSPKK